MTPDHAAPLRLTSLGHAGPAARWRTEAMRSHDTARLIHISKGQGRITVAGLTAGYGPHNLIYIPPRTMYGIEVGSTVYGQMLALPAPTGWPDAPFHLRLVEVTRQAELTGLLDSIEKELGPKGELRAANCYVGLLEVFVERQLQSSPPNSGDARRNTAAARLVARYTGMIATDFPALRSVADYAAALGVTGTHLTRACRKTCGRSALWLLNERRFYDACVMLQDGTTPINKVAASLGFGSAAYFTRSFQARAGVSPSAFRENRRRTTAG